MEHTSRIDRIAKRITASYDLARRALRELGLSGCKMSRMQRTSNCDEILETTRLAGSSEAMADLGRFLEENGYDGPSSCEVEVVHDVSEYQEPVDGVSYGHKGDGICIRLNGREWKWGMLVEI